MKKHPMAGKPVKISSGPLKDQYFIVIDFLVNQYQGKSIKGIYDSHQSLVDPTVKRTKLLDENIVFGRFHPSMIHGCVHDTEIQIEPPKLELVTEVKDDSGSTGESDNKLPRTRKPRSKGRSVPSGKSHLKIADPIEPAGQEDSTTGSPDK